MLFKRLCIFALSFFVEYTQNSNQIGCFVYIQLKNL